jgi:EAL domain-containing protein (putative c-di-GMP-specific phosphodiesterase class I)
MILALGETLGLTVIASGVETQKQADALKTLGCHLMEGGLLSKPLLPMDLTAAAEKAIVESIH